MIFIFTISSVLVLSCLCVCAIYRQGNAAILKAFCCATETWKNLIITISLEYANQKKRLIDMAGKQSKDMSYSSSSNWLDKPKSVTDLQLHIRGTPFTLDRELLVAKSAKVADLLKQHSEEDVCHFLRNIPANLETFEHVARFCYGFELHITSENVVPLACLAYYLGMTETHSPNNLLRKSLTIFEHKILPSWNETVKAFRTTENIQPQAIHLGLVNACIESMVTKAEADPFLLGEPIENCTHGEDDVDGICYRPITRRKLFVTEVKQEDLTILSLQLYEPTIRAMSHRGIPPKYVAASLCKYVEKWVFSGTTGEGKMSVYIVNCQREIIEAVERLMPKDRGLVPCTLLVKMLRFAISLEACSECRSGFEMRIGKQLDQATVSDLFIPAQGYTKELSYDVECLRRILKNFYGSYADSNIEGIITVADLIEEFLVEVAEDMELKTTAFVSLAEMSSAASSGTGRNADGIYRIVDIYLDKHRHLTESEKEEVCKVIDYHNMSAAACEHAAKNERLPIRMVMHVLFLWQLKLRDTIMKEMQGSETAGMMIEEEEGEESGFLSEDPVRIEMEKMSSKVMDLERECLIMRREIEGSCRHNVKKGKGSMWGDMKRKFGCISKVNNCNCHVKKKKVHPKLGV